MSHFEPLCGHLSFPWKIYIHFFRFFFRTTDLIEETFNSTRPYCCHSFLFLSSLYLVRIFLMSFVQMWSPIHVCVVFFSLVWSRRRQYEEWRTTKRRMRARCGQHRSMITFANNLVTSESMIPYVVRFALIFGCVAVAAFFYVSRSPPFIGVYVFWLDWLGLIWFGLRD